MQSKLTLDYPMEEDYLKWITFGRNVNYKDADQVMLKRLAALGKYFNKKVVVISAYRSTELQKELYIKSGGKFINGKWSGGNGTVARPNSSMHEKGLAVDVSSEWTKELEKNESTKNQKILGKFGLYKPLTSGNGTSVKESWHIQPILTSNVGVVNKTSISPTNANVKPIIKEVVVNMPAVHIGSGGAAVKELQNLLNKKGYKLIADGSFGPSTERAVKDFQKKNGLTSDGKVGPMTWKKLK